MAVRIAQARGCVRYAAALVQYLDEVVIPAFRFVSGDQRRAVLGRKQTNEFKEATEEYVGLVQEAIEYKFEPQRSSAASGDDAKPEACRRSATALILAGRGSEDLAVSQLIAEAIRLERGIDARCSPLGGLTGISSAAESGADEPPEVVALVSVGTVTWAQLDILLRCAASDAAFRALTSSSGTGTAGMQAPTWWLRRCVALSRFPLSSTSSAGIPVYAARANKRLGTSKPRPRGDGRTRLVPCDVDARDIHPSRQ